MFVAIEDAFCAVFYWHMFTRKDGSVKGSSGAELPTTSQPFGCFGYRGSLTRTAAAAVGAGGGGVVGGGVVGQNVGFFCIFFANQQQLACKNGKKFKIIDKYKLEIIGKYK
jgi:hypothetical protein